MFRLYPEGSFLYCQVNIWPTKKAMREHTLLPRNAEASCGGREEYIVPPKREKKPVRKTGLFAEVNFYRNRIGIEVVSHEMTHGTFAFADRRKLDIGKVLPLAFAVSGANRTLDRDCAEERFCYALGVMCRQFTQKCYDLGLYQDVVTSKT